jgi:O-antigen/teichoic acid export membrane protein
MLDHWKTYGTPGLDGAIGRKWFLLIRQYFYDPFYRNSVAMMLTTVLSSLFGILFWIVAAKTMQSGSVGLASTVASTIFLITMVSTLGMDVALIRYLPTSKSKGELISTIIISIALVSVILALLYVLNLRSLAPELTFLQESVPFAVFFAFVAFSTVNIMLNVTFTTIRKSGIYLAQNIILGIRVPILYLIAPLGTLGALASFCIAYIVSTMYGIYMLHRCGLPLKLKINTALLRNITHFSMGNYVASIFIIAPGMIMPMIIVSTLGASESAYYYIAYSIANLLFMIPSAIASSLFIEGSYEIPLRKNIVRSVKFIILLLVPLTALIFLYGDKLLLIFSSEYSEGSFELLRLLALSSLPSSIVSIYLVIKRIQKDMLAISLVTFIISAMIIGIGYVALLKIGLAGLGYIWLGVYSAIGAILVMLLYKDVFMNRADGPA